MDLNMENENIDSVEPCILLKQNGALKKFQYEKTKEKEYCLFHPCLSPAKKCQSIFLSIHGMLLRIG